jgi:AraC-like DNA-binding protein
MTAMPLQSIADFLGYSSQTSFTRACRRWFGEPPQALRSRSGRAPRVTSADD